MPKMKICPKGHYYDSAKYATCPYCPANDGSQKPDKTEPLDEYKTRGNPAPGGNDGKTKSIWDEDESGDNSVTPVVGWLVCTEGVDKCKDFRLHADNNFVGRGSQCDVRLSDEYVSKKHFTVTYDPFSDIHFASMSDGRAIVYINGIPLTSSMVALKKGDKIKVAKTTLVFIPLDKDDVQWNWSL